MLVVQEMDQLPSMHFMESVTSLEGDYPIYYGYTIVSVGISQTLFQHCQNLIGFNMQGIFLTERWLGHSI